MPTCDLAQTRDKAEPHTRNAKCYIKSPIKTTKIFRRGCGHGCGEMMNGLENAVSAAAFPPLEAATSPVHRPGAEDGGRSKVARAEIPGVAGLGRKTRSAFFTPILASAFFTRSLRVFYVILCLFLLTHCARFFTPIRHHVFYRVFTRFFNAFFSFLVAGRLGLSGHCYFSNYLGNVVIY